MKNQQLRIIGGIYKRRNLNFASVPGLRPTPDRLRETLFNWLMYDIKGAAVLDTCAGSGALAFEAVSRGAAHCTLIEPHKKQFAMLKKAVTVLSCEAQVTLINQHAESALATVASNNHNSPDSVTNLNSFDVIFLDPPYALDLWLPLLEIIFRKELIKPDGLIYIEADRSHDELNLPQCLIKQKEKKVGQIVACLYQYQPVVNT